MDKFMEDFVDHGPLKKFILDNFIFGEIFSTKPLGYEMSLFLFNKAKKEYSYKLMPIQPRYETMSYLLIVPGTFELIEYLD